MILCNHWLRNWLWTSIINCFFLNLVIQFQLNCSTLWSSNIGRWGFGPNSVPIIFQYKITTRLHHIWLLLPFSTLIDWSKIQFSHESEVGKSTNHRFKNPLLIFYDHDKEEAHPRRWGRSNSSHSIATSLRAHSRQTS